MNDTLELILEELKLFNDGDPESPPGHPLWGPRQVAQYFQIDESDVLEKVACKPDFPKPASNDCGGIKWWKDEVKQWVRGQREDYTPTQLYRHYDKDGVLLYVGISLSAVSRTRDHSIKSPWFYDVARIDIELYRSRDQALAAEKEAIVNEAPVHNKANKPKVAESQPE